MKTLLPIFFIIFAGAIFFWFIDPTYGTVQTLRAEEAAFDEALTRSRELQEIRDQLLSRYNTFLPRDLERLEKLLPDHIDNVRLILDLDAIAARYGMRVRDVVLESSETATTRAARAAVGTDSAPYASVVLTFSVSGSYDTFRAFLADLEQSLRLVDVVSISFTATEPGVYDYGVGMKTYWLKP